MSITLSPATIQEWRALKPLFIRAFPPEERPPYFMLRSRARKGRGQMLAIRENHTCVGFFYLITHADLAYLFLFAVEDGHRGKGVGTAALAELKKLYAGKRLFLAREQLDEGADNYLQRVRRHGFYLRCGFQDLPCFIREGKVTYDTMGIGGPVTPEDYDALITPWAGKWLKKRVELRLIPQ